MTCAFFDCSSGGTQDARLFFCPITTISNFFLMPLRIVLFSDSTCPFVWGLETELNRVCMLNLWQYSLVVLLLNCLPLSEIIARATP